MTLFELDDAQPTPVGPTVRVKLVVAYDGSGFRGFARQPGVKTVGGTLTVAIERVLGHAVELTCAGRTDAGVHGWGQVVSFDALADAVADAADLEHLQRAVSKLCSPAVVVRSAEVAPGFDARRSALARRYRYTILNREVGDPFLASTAWHVSEPLDLAAMRLACDPIIGEHDFSSFSRRPRGDQAASMVRRVLDARWDALGGGVLRFEIIASSFCHQMVRGLVGTMVEMGRGRRRAGEMASILRARDRSAARGLAPPHGLCLWAVEYAPQEADSTR